MKTVLLWAALTGSAFCAVKTKPADPTPGEPLVATMGQRKPVRIRVARGQVTLIGLPEGQRVMSTYGGDKGDGGVWSVDAGKVPTRFLAVKPKEIGIHTTLHVISNTGQEISFFLEEITGQDGQFDGRVDAEVADDGPSIVQSTQVKWVPADEVLSCKIHTDTLKADIDEASKKAKVDTAAALVDYQTAYPKKLFFDYSYDRAKAERLGLAQIWSDDKFTYIRGDKVLALYEINEDGKPSLIQYAYADGIYTVPKLLYDGYLAIGPKKQNKLTFHRERSKS